MIGIRRFWRGAFLSSAFLTGVLLVAPATAHAAGALAVGACRAYGYSYDFGDISAARRAALANCAGQSCKVVTTLRRNCTALATDTSKACGAVGWAVRPRLGAAQNEALKLCYQRGGKDCVIRAFVCDGKG
jgi:hypothetical protein